MLVSRLLLPVLDISDIFGIAASCREQLGSVGPSGYHGHRGRLYRRTAQVDMNQMNTAQKTILVERWDANFLLCET